MTTTRRRLLLFITRYMTNWCDCASFSLCVRFFFHIFVWLYVCVCVCVCVCLNGTVCTCEVLLPSHGCKLSCALFVGATANLLSLLSSWLSSLVIVIIIIVAIIPLPGSSYYYSLCHHRCSYFYTCLCRNCSQHIVALVASCRMNRIFVSFWLLMP